MFNYVSLKNVIMFLWRHGSIFLSGFFWYLLLKFISIVCTVLLVCDLRLRRTQKALQLSFLFFLSLFGFVFNAKRFAIIFLVTLLFFLLVTFFGRPTTSHKIYWDNHLLKKFSPLPLRSMLMGLQETTETMPRTNYWPTTLI